MTAPTQTPADPFAAVQVPAAQRPAAPAQVPADPFNGVDVDQSDPFATGETVNAGGGNFRPTPGPEALNGRLVVYIPRSFRKDAKVPESFAKFQGETREEWRADLYVLDRRDLTYTANRTDQNGVKTQETITIPAADMPAEFLDTFVPQAALIGQLRKVDGTAKPLLMGVLRRGPKAEQKKAGKTFADIEREYAAWMQAMGQGRKTTEPGFSWQVDVDVTPDQKALALAWWKSVATTIKPLTKAQDRTGQTGR